ncbi:histidine kinase [Belliella baltica DSM 15883]|uniref:histidine kinase n=1 Tax=Belliella baltica (strain DSM 15883 / CIP 108006 / LMG 21964 / BA134) TaxID=866536 RepID=I3Z4H5_BELBD|nr:ATP-binding protein [Belliella baltica]AFL84143.1 histidine kinase [Belliella baltica DSM 15883]
MHLTKRIQSIFLPLILCIFFIFSLELSAFQISLKDSIKNYLVSESSENDKFEKLKAIIDGLTQDNKQEDVIFFYEQGIKLAEKTGNFRELGIWSVQLFEILNSESNTEEKALELMLHASKFVPQIDQSRTQGNIYLKLAAAHYNQTDFSEAIEAYTLAMNYFSEKDSIFVADALFFRAQAKDYRGELISAMNDYQLARTYYENLEDQDYVNYVNNGMAVLFSKYGIYSEAEKIRKQLAENYLDQGNIYDWSIILYNQSRDYDKQDRNDERFDFLNRVYQKIGKDSIADSEVRAIVCLSLSNHYSEIQDYENQEKLYQEAKQIIEDELDGNSFIKLPFLKSKTLIEESRGNLSEAKNLIQQYREDALEAANMDQIIDAYLIESRISKNVGDFKTAFEALEKYKSFKDSLFQSNQANSFAYYQTLYETEKKEREILNKTREIEQITTSTRTKIITIVTISLSIIAGLILWFLLKNLKAAQKAKILQENFSRDLLLSQETERKRISKDLHDGLGQSLLLIKNKVAMDKDESATNLLNLAIEELRGISRSLHPFQLEELGLTNAIRNVLDQIDEETDIFVSSELDEVDDLFDADQQLHIYRIVQETFNNILKHAKASAVRVTIIRDEKMVHLSIADNGIGFDFSKKFQDFQSLGLKTLKERTATLGGIMKVDSEKAKGTSFSFLFYP